MYRSTTFIREQRTYCGAQYMTVDLFQYTEAAQMATRKHRRRREKVSLPKQRNLNSKRARRYFIQLVNANFGLEDIHFTATYDRDHLPETEEDAKREVRNYLRRVEYRRRKLGLPPMKYIVVTEYGANGKRIHHHIIMSGGISRDDLELMWTQERINWKKAERDPAYRRSLRRIGYANADRLQFGENGLEALARYLMKDPAGKKRWSGSQNLEKPVRATNDTKYSVRMLERFAESGMIWEREFWEKRYPGYTLAGAPDIAVEATPPDEMNNWIIFAKLRKCDCQTPMVRRKE